MLAIYRCDISCRHWISILIDDEYTAKTTREGWRKCLSIVKNSSRLPYPSMPSIKLLSVKNPFGTGTPRPCTSGGLVNRWQRVVLSSFPRWSMILPADQKNFRQSRTRNENVYGFTN